MRSVTESRARGKGKNAPSTKKGLELFHFWTGPEQPPVDAFIDRFEEKNPDIKVSRNALDWGSHMLITGTRIKEGNPPDVFINEIGHFITRFVRGKQLEDLTDLWGEQGFSDVFPHWFKEGCSFNGRVYGVPSKQYIFAVWYLTDVFEEHGVKPPKTWDDFLEVCKTFKEAGIPPIISSGWGTALWFRHILGRIGGTEFYNGLMRGEESWTDSRVIEAYEMLRDLLREYFCPSPFGYNFILAWMRLNKREAAMQLQGDWLDGMWRRKFNYTPQVEYDCFLLPPIDPRVGRLAVISGNAWVMPKKAPHPEETKAFMRYAGSLEGQEILAREGMGILARKDVPKEAYNPLLAKLREEVTKNSVVLDMGTMLPPKVVSTEELQRMRIVSNPTIKRKEIKEIGAAIEMAAKGF